MRSCNDSSFKCGKTNTSIRRCCTREVQLGSGLSAWETVDIGDMAEALL